jgi:hypothetical protein
MQEDVSVWAHPLFGYKTVTVTTVTMWPFGDEEANFVKVFYFYHIHLVRFVSN